MQTNQVTARTRRPSVQQGLIFGIIVGVLLVINEILTNLANFGAIYPAAISSLILIIYAILVLVGLFVYAVAGFRASAQTGRIAPGTIAGLIAGVIGGIIGFIVTLIIAIATASTAAQRAQALANQAHVHFQYTSSIIITAALGVALFGLAATIGLGAAFGAIGGSIGRRRAPQVPYQEQFYQGTPPPPMNPSDSYNQGYSPNQGYPPNGQGYPQQPGYQPNNQENPYP